METSSAFSNRSRIFIGILLLVSKFILPTSNSPINRINYRVKKTKSNENFIFLNSFLTESPRWLISKGREEAAYRIVFNKKCDMEFAEKVASKQKEAEQVVIYT